MSSYFQKKQVEEKSHQRGQIDRQDFNRRQASAKIKDFNWGDEKLGIRRVDVGVFQAAARAFDHIILVRATTFASLQYIGNKNMYPKPMDCKAKTADNNVYIHYSTSRSIFSKTAGLVVDPTIVGAKAFEDAKYDKVMEAWHAFLKDKTPDEIKCGIFRRRGNSGSYAVDLNTNSHYYGCLMISNHNDVVALTNATNDGTYKFDETGMQYIHGDYDLYALLDVDDINELTLTEWINGQENFCSKKFNAIKEFINNGIGSPMVQHGDQFRIKHQSDKLYAFYPTGSAYKIYESGQSIKEIFALVYGVKSAN